MKHVLDIDPVKVRRIRRLSRFHRRVYQATGGVIGRRLVDNDILLLTTRGRRTGRPHTIPLLFLRDGPRLVVVASFGGRPHHPAWYHNLVAHPTVKVQTSTETFVAQSTTAGPADRSTWWPRIVEAYRGYATYQSKTDRKIPVVFLDRLEGVGPRSEDSSRVR